MTDLQDRPLEDRPSTPAAARRPAGHGPDAPHRKPGKRGARPGLAASYLVLILGCLVVVIPFAWEALTTTKSFGESIHVPPVIFPSHWTWANYASVFSSVPFTRQFLNTLIVALVRTAGQLVICSAAGYAFARLNFPFKRTLFTTFLAVLMVPSQLFIIPQYQIMIHLHWLNSLQALIVPGLFSAFGTFLLRQFFLTLPKELDEAAEIDGCNPFQRYLHVALPLAKPGLLALGVLTLLNSWNDLLWPLIVNTDPGKMTLAAGLASLQGQYVTNYPVLMAGTLMASLPVVIVFAVMQKHFIQGIAASGVKG